MNEKKNTKENLSYTAETKGFRNQYNQNILELLKYTRYNMFNISMT